MRIINLHTYFEHNKLNQSTDFKVNKTFKFSTLSLLFLMSCMLISISNKNHAFHSNNNKNLAQIANNGIKKIVIDAGHGGKDPGCVVKGSSYEKDIALDIALKLGAYLKDSLKNVEIIYTRTTDKFIELYQRAAIANNANADIFLSIHCNYNPNSIFHGFESYIMGTHKSDANLEVSKRENESILLESDYETNKEYDGFDPNSPESNIIFSLYQNAYMDQSTKLASQIHNTLKQDTITTKDIKQAGFLVLWKTAMPSILLETGFLSNSTDKSILNSEEGRKKIAFSIMKGVRKYKEWYVRQ